MQQHTDTDHENPAVQALIDAALAVDEQLPGAWSRVAEYLEAYGEDTGTPLGRRKLDGDGNVAVLTVADLHILIGALETILEAHTGPEEPAPAAGAVLYTATAFRAEVEATAKNTMLELAELRIINASDWDRVAQTVTAAVWSPIEHATFQAAASLAAAEAVEHEPGCHGRDVAVTLAHEIVHGDNGEERNHNACGVLLEAEYDSVGLADLNAKLDQILKHVSPLPTAIKYDLQSRPAAGPLADGGVVVNIQPEPGGGSATDALAIGYAAGVRAARQGRR